MVRAEPAGILLDESRPVVVFSGIGLAMYRVMAARFHLGHLVIMSLALVASACGGSVPEEAQAWNALFERSSGFGRFDAFRLGGPRFGFERSSKERCHSGR
jgi:hypothetical protein